MRSTRPTAPDRPHFTHLRAGDLEIFAGFLAHALPDDGAYAPSPPEAEWAAEDATDEITHGYRLPGEPGPL